MPIKQPPSQHRTFLDPPPGLCPHHPLLLLLLFLLILALPPLLDPTEIIQRHRRQNVKHDIREHNAEVAPALVPRYRGGGEHLVGIRGRAVGADCRGRRVEDVAGRAGVEVGSQVGAAGLVTAGGEGEGGEFVGGADYGFVVQACGGPCGWWTLVFGSGCRGLGDWLTASNEIREW